MSYIEMQLSENKGWDDPETIAPKVRVENPCDEMNIYQVWTCLIEPALLGCGFTKETIDSLFGENK